MFSNLSRNQRANITLALAIARKENKKEAQKYLKKENFSDSAIKQILTKGFKLPKAGSTVGMGMGMGSAPAPAPKIPIENRDITVPGYPKPKMMAKPTLKAPSKTPKTPKAPRPKAKATAYKVIKPAKYTVKKVAVKPTPKVVRAPAKAPASKAGGSTKPKKTMSAEHKAKIAKGVKKHHADCKKAMSMMKKMKK